MKCCNCKNLGKLIDEDGVAYDWCEEIIDNPDIYDERLCHHFVVGNKADEIRRMTDEELAIYLQSICNCIECPTKRPCQAKTVGDCQKVWLDFLRKDLDFGEVMKEVKDYSPRKDPQLIDCKTECGNEHCLAKRYGLFAEKTCPNFVEPKPITNADRIRAMTDEELAGKFEEIQLEAVSAYGNDNLLLKGELKGYWLDWLKQASEAEVV